VRPERSESTPIATAKLRFRSSKPAGTCQQTCGQRYEVIAVVALMATMTVGAFGWWVGSYAVVMAVLTVWSVAQNGAEAILLLLPAAGYLAFLWLVSWVGFIIFQTPFG
jgi:hypothetical protein